MSSEPQKSDETPPNTAPHSATKSTPEKTKPEPQKNGSQKVINFDASLTKVRLPIPKSIIRVPKEAPKIEASKPQNQIVNNQPQNLPISIQIPEKKDEKEDHVPQFLTPENFKGQDFEVRLYQITPQFLEKLNSAKSEQQQPEQNKIIEKPQTQETSENKTIQEVSKPQPSTLQQPTVVHAVVNKPIKTTQKSPGKKVILKPGIPPQSILNNPTNAQSTTIPPLAPKPVVTQQPAPLTASPTKIVATQNTSQTLNIMNLVSNVNSPAPAHALGVQKTTPVSTIHVPVANATVITMKRTQPITQQSTQPVAGQVNVQKTQPTVSAQQIAFQQLAKKDVTFPQMLLNTQGNQHTVTFSASQNTQVSIPISPAQIANLQFLAKIDTEKKLINKIAIAQQQVHVQPPPPPPPPAAPLPELPSAQSIQKLIDEIDENIARLNEKIAELDQERDMISIKVPPCSDIKTEFGIQNYHGFLMQQHPVEDLKKQNATKIAKSHSKNLLQNNTVISHITQYHNLVGELTSERNLSQPMMRVVLHGKTLLRERRAQLAYEYKLRTSPYKSFIAQLNIYNSEIHECVDIWPPEFAMNKTKTTDRSVLLPLCAPDQPMLLDEGEMKCNLYYDENSFVADPVKEHEEYKKRLVWTASEKQIFLEKYAQHPREFKKIAAGLPAKTVKDVIEYYYINRIKLNLKAIENMTRTKGRKKVITEGPSSK